MSGVLGLNVSDIVDVTVNLTPLPVPLRNFGTLMLIGPTEGIINVGQRYRTYTDISRVAADFGTSAPEYKAALLFFQQVPQPALLYIGRWAQSATHGWLTGAIIPAAEQLPSFWTGVTNGSFTISIDGVPHNITGLNFSSVTNMNGVASIVQAGLPAGATCQWNAVYQYFAIRGIATGASGAVSYATPEGAGTDISGTALTPYLGLSLAAGAQTPVAGIVAETPLQCMVVLAGQTTSWYGAMFAPTNATDITDSQYEDVAGFVEAQNPSRVFGITTMSSLVPSSATNDICTALQTLGYQHSFVQYSSSSAYVCASMFGRAFTVDYTANNSSITLKFKVEPGVAAETLSETQAGYLNAKNCNVFINYANVVSTPIIQQGVMCGGFFFDERAGLDWLQNNVQTKLFNIHYTSPTKLPQTDAGVHVLTTGVEDAMIDGINNGLISPGKWNSTYVFGAMTSGMYLSKGYYVWAPPLSTQSEAIRATRVAPTILAAVKLAGAVHFAGCTISVNR